MRVKQPRRRGFSRVAIRRRQSASLRTSGKRFCRGLRIFFCEQWPVVAQGLEVEELQAGDEGFEGSFGDAQLIADVEEVVFDVAFAEVIGRDQVVGSELANGPDIQLLGALTQASEVHVADHTVTEVGHGDTLWETEKSPAPTAGSSSVSHTKTLQRSPLKPRVTCTARPPLAAKPLRPRPWSIC